MADIRKNRPALEATGTQLAFVHTSTEDRAEGVFRKFGLEDLPRIADPDGALYAAFGLQKGRFGQIFGLKPLTRGLTATLSGHLGGSAPIGDPMMMPGAFLVHQEKIVAAFRHRAISDRPNYLGIANCDSGACEITEKRE